MASGFVANWSVMMGAMLFLVLGASPAWAQGDAAECSAIVSPSACDVISEAMRPRWTVRGGVVAVDRVTADPLTLVQSTTSTAEQLNARDMHYDWQIGFDFSLLRRAWDDTAFELRYLDLGEVSGRQRIPVSDSQVRITTAPPIFIPDVQSIDARFGSDLFSIEANYRYPMYEFLTVLGGFRYVSFEDDLYAAISTDAQDASYRVSTRNRMYGGQIGLVTVPWRPEIGCLWLSAFGKAGVYGNDSDHRGIVDTGLSRLAAGQSTDDSSFLGEFGATSTVWLSDCLSLSCSYSLVWLESVAIATRQVPVSNFVAGVGGTDHGSTVFHGATLAIAWQH